MRAGRSGFGPVEGGGFDCLVVVVEVGLEEEDGGDAAGDVGDVADLLGLEGAGPRSEQGANKNEPDSYR